MVQYVYTRINKKFTLIIFFSRTLSEDDSSKLLGEYILNNIAKFYSEIFGIRIRY